LNSHWPAIGVFFDEVFVRRLSSPLHKETPNHWDVRKQRTRVRSKIRHQPFKCV
jgi:hypothetical protein